MNIHEVPKRKKKYTLLFCFNLSFEELINDLILSSSINRLKLLSQLPLIKNLMKMAYTYLILAAGECHPPVWGMEDAPSAQALRIVRTAAPRTDAPQISGGDSQHEKKSLVHVDKY